MSSNVVDVGSTLEAALAAMPQVIAIASENTAYTPTAGVPYCEANLLLAQPSDLELGSQGAYREQGVFLVRLNYPLQVGKGQSLAFAALLRAYFKRGTTFAGSNGVQVTIDKTAEIAPGSVDGDRWVTPVRIRFYSNVTQ